MMDPRPTIVSSSSGDTELTKNEVFSKPCLPEDVWSHIHSLMDMKDAGRAACLSRSFLLSWRCRPCLVFDNATIGPTSSFYNRVDQILNNHSGVGVKTLKIEVPVIDYNPQEHTCYLDRWLQIAVTPGIQELMLHLPLVERRYCFPHSLLPRSGDSIRQLCLNGCSFNPTGDLGWSKNLTRLCLLGVSIKGDELERLLSTSLALERLEIVSCDHILSLKIPSSMQRLSYLEILGGSMLRVVDIVDAPNLSGFRLERGPQKRLLLGEKLQMKNLRISFPGAHLYFRVELPSVMPNLETVTIFSNSEPANLPMLQSKYLHLKYLRIFFMVSTFSPTFDYFSLVSIFDACPTLETFILNATQLKMKHVSVITDPSALRQMPNQCHHKLKTVEIIGFTSAKSLVELTCHIAECSPSLECLKLVTGQCNDRCCGRGDEFLKEVRRALLAIRTYVEPKVPSTVLHVLEPCSGCQAL